MFTMTVRSTRILVPLALALGALGACHEGDTPLDRDDQVPEEALDDPGEGWETATETSSEPEGESSESSNDGSANEPAQEGVCDAPGEVCVEINVPPEFSGTAQRLTVNFYTSLPPAGPPSAFGVDLSNPELVPGASFPVKMSGIAALGDVHILVVAYMPGGGTMIPVPGVDWMGQTASSRNLDGGAFTLDSPIRLALVDDGTGGSSTTDPGTDPGNDPGNDRGNDPGPETDPGASGGLPTFTRVTLYNDLPGAAWLTPADLDGDGYDEYLLTSLSEGVDLLSLPPLAPGGAYILARDGAPTAENPGLGTWSSQKAFDQSAGYGFPNRSKLYDVDNDGVEDWFIAGGFLAKPTGYLLWMKGVVNEGVLSFGAPQELPIPDNARWYHEIHPVDLDSDGDLDFITTNNNSAVEGLGGLAYGTSRLEWFENLGVAGQASFVAHTIADAGGALFTTYDLDADGDEDVILPQFFGGSSLIWMENPGDPFDAWTAHVINDTTGKGFGVELADIDGDGAMELVYGNHNHQASSDPNEQVMGIYYWDIPEAGLAELADWDSTMHVVYEGFYVAADNPDQEGAPGVIHVGDVDGDGDLDISASGDGDHGIYLFIQQAPGQFQMTQIDDGQAMAGDHVMTDLDGDGDMDYLWCVFGESGMSGVNSNIHAYLQNDTPESSDVPTDPTDPTDPSGDDDPQDQGDGVDNAGNGSDGQGGANDGADDETDAETGDNTPATDPMAWGSYGVITVSEALSIGSGFFPTTVPVTIYLPEGEGPFPVVLFTDGFNLSSDLYASYGQHLASWGYVTLCADIPHSLLQPKTDEEMADIFANLLDWVQAEGLNVSGPFQGKADITELALGGHSSGGKASIYNGILDARPSVIFAIDPVDAAQSFGGGGGMVSVTPELMDQLTLPLLLVGETTNDGTTSFNPAPCAPAAENFQQYYLAATGPALEIEILGANHMSFLDNPNCGLSCTVCPAGTDNPATTRALTQGYITAFLNLHLRGQTAYRSYLTGFDMDVDIAEGWVTAQHKNGF